MANLSKKAFISMLAFAAALSLTVACNAGSCQGGAAANTEAMDKGGSRVSQKLVIPGVHAADEGP